MAAYPAETAFGDPARTAPGRVRPLLPLRRDPAIPRKILIASPTMAEATWLLAVRRPSASFPSGDRVSELLPRQPLDVMGRAGTMPSREFELLVLERVRGLEELLQLLACPGRKVEDVLQIGLERGAVGYREHTVVPLLLALGLLLDLEDPDGSASKHHAGIGLRIVDDQNVERVAVFRLGRRNEAPVVRWKRRSRPPRKAGATSGPRVTFVTAPSQAQPTLRLVVNNTRTSQSGLGPDETRRSA